MTIALKRVYEPASKDDGYRVLVDRLWPRGVSKAEAHIDLWLKDIAPSTELRKWYNHDPAKWDEFKTRYDQELDGQPEVVQRLAELVSRQQVTLIYSTRATEQNHAVALKQYLDSR